MTKYILPIVIGISFLGCSEKTIDIAKKPDLQIPKVIEPIKRKKGSLYTRRGPSLFSDKKDLQIGDIIQVIVQEGLTNSSSDSMTSGKSSSTSISGGLITNRTDGLGKNSKVRNTASTLNPLLGVGLNATTTNSFKGNVKATADEEFTTTISAVITEIYQNGNYFIEGSKEMLINGQKQLIKISGLIRPYDITPENTIYSYQLANLKVLYGKDGESMDSVRKSWGTKFIEAISPF